MLLELSKFRFSNGLRRSVYIISASLAIGLCILFPIPVMDGYIMDLRLVALTIAGLYGGISTSIILGGVTVIFRFLVGGIGAVATLILVSVFLLFLISMNKIFHNSSRQKKVIVGSSLSLFAGLLALLNSTIIFGATFSWTFIIIYFSLSFCTTALIIYLYEIFQENLLINKRVIKAEKMDIVSHLAASVSHEVRNPLTVVRGFLQMMEQKDLSEDKRRAFLKISIEEIDRANDIIKNYLTFAKPSPETEKLKIISIKQLLHNTLPIITPLANINSVIVDTEMTNDYFFEGDEHIFQQCLINIMKNCIEAMPNGGKVSVEAKKKESELIIIITDNGNGMTKEQLSRLGEPYFTTKGREGTGLGMMAAFKIIETMKGKLNVTSKLNEGTNFYIELPIVEKDSK
ncbi:ATP-binding protein [Salipaludibacillus sp. CF4.18]|uniref:ATP-binding protein n=1 Tax=Salipaludibacillus sp. CF4.18 TaxID=3373081 RepID=UPI003EE6C986